MKQVIFMNIQESPLKIVAGGGWRSAEDWKRHRKSAACMVFVVVWSSLIFLIRTLPQTPSESSGFLGHSLALWLLPALTSLGCAFYFWRKEKSVPRESMSKPVPPYRLRNFY